MNGYYVYVLKDPSISPAEPFYIGKGAGTRAWDHVSEPDGTRKGKRISEILSSGQKVVIAKICDGLTEIHALKIEADLISFLGTIESGGPLTNVVVPSGKPNKKIRALNIPVGTPEKAQLGLSLLKAAVFDLAQANQEGVMNADVCHALKLYSNYEGASKDYLSYSVLGLLLDEDRLEVIERDGHKYHIVS